MENQNLDRIFLEDDKVQRMTIYWKGILTGLVIVDLILGLAVAASLFVIK